MDESKKSCEGECAFERQINEPNFIVITGGPGAGKTALLEYVRKLYCNHVAILPEAAGILFNGGFWRLQSPTAKNSAQRAIYHVQKEMESLVREEKKWILGLCDRGTLDGLAYWNGSDEDFFSSIQSDLQSELAKYQGVLHLSSPSLANGYNNQNPLRNESPETAKRIDLRIEKIWSSHPNYIKINSTTDFLSKLRESATALQKMTGPHLKLHELK